jgi:hypothetical protein
VTTISDPLPLYHGTTGSSAETVVATGFAAPDVATRLRNLANLYEIDFDTLVTEIGEFVWHRDRHDPHIHFATNPRLAASYARRGSEIDYFARQAIWRLRNPTTDKHDPSWSRRGMEWAKSEVARNELPALVRANVPLAELSAEKVKGIEDVIEVLGESQGPVYHGEEFLLLPDVASKYIFGIELVKPCTCWRDKAPCHPCRDFYQSPGGWNGTFV